MESFYIASDTYYQVISKTIEESGNLLVGGEHSNAIYLLKYVKTYLNRISGYDEFVIDLSALKDVDSEIIDAIEMIRVNYENTRIIIVAANRYEGDELLTKCFQMGVYDLIVSDDFNEIKSELLDSLREAKTYKQAIRFKDLKIQTEKTVIKTEIKKTVNKVLIGICGTQNRIGTTHNSIILANSLRKKGYMVAIVELNKTAAFDAICESFDQKKFENEYYSMNGIDFYSNITDSTLGRILGKTYNFIICDFGSYEEADQVLYGKCDVRIIISGTKPWETEALSKIFGNNPKETLQQYNYFFNLASETQQNDIRSGMGDLKRVYFQDYQADPFSSSTFAGCDEILKEYLPEPTEVKKKKSLFGKR